MLSADVLIVEIGSVADTALLEIVSGRIISGRHFQEVATYQIYQVFSFGGMTFPDHDSLDDRFSISMSFCSLHPLPHICCSHSTLWDRCSRRGRPARNDNRLGRESEQHNKLTPHN